MRRLLSGVGILAAISLAACGGDDADDGNEAAPATSATQPPTETQPAAEPPAQGDQATPAPSKPPKPVPAPPTATPDPCTTPKSISRLRFKGLGCTMAASIADSWNRMPNRCNTIDDPSSPEGYKRTCVIQGYTCAAKRDTKSEARFVACSMGSARLRFTWAPA